MGKLTNNIYERQVNDKKKVHIISIFGVNMQYAVSLSCCFQFQLM